MAASTCPVCGQNDAVASVANVISSGMTSESGFGVGYIAGGVAPMMTSSFSQTQLSSRLMPPPPPGYFPRGRFFLWCLLFTLVAAFAFAFAWKGVNVFPDPVTGALTVFFCVVPAALLMVVGFIPVYCLLHWHPIRRREWNNDTNYLGNSYYCGRDDVIFDALGNYDSPEGFIPRLFAHSS